MSRTDKLLFGFVFGSVFPILFAFLAVTLWFVISKNESVVFYYLTFGLLTGLVTNRAIQQRLIDRAYDLPDLILAFFYVFYSVGIYGMFMGFPVFNLITGVVAGYYFGKRIVYKNLPEDQQRAVIRKVSRFTTWGMVVICVLTALMALNEETIGLEVQGMLGLKTEVTQGMIYAIIVVGGTLLVVCQYFLTHFTIHKTMQTVRRKHLK